jgi:hypothetical protein
MRILPAKEGIIMKIIKMPVKISKDDGGWNWKWLKEALQPTRVVLFADIVG